MTPLLFTLIALPPSGTTTARVLGEWLTQATGVPHAIGGDLQDYPVYLSVRSGEPGRIKALVAIALAGEWTREGSTIRLLPKSPKRDEGFEGFEREWKVATANRPNLAVLPLRDLAAMKAGEILRYGMATGPYVRRLPDAIRSKVEVDEMGQKAVYVRRFAHGCFETSIGEKAATSSKREQVEFRSLPPEFAAALGNDEKKPAMSPDEIAAMQKSISNLGTTDPNAILVKDPLIKFVDPVLGAVSKSLDKDVVVALPDFALMGLMGQDKTTVGSVLRTFCLFDDLSMVEGAVVGRLPVSERRNRSQTRRSVMASFIRRTQDAGVPGAAAVADYLSGQRPAASESWTDVMMLISAGVVLDQTEIGDYPFNLRLAAAFTPIDWTRLQTGNPIPARALSAKALTALSTLLIQSRKRMDWKDPDPVRWPGFPNVELTLSATVEEEDVVLGVRNGATQVMRAGEAGNGYAQSKKNLGSEPLYRVGHRRKLMLTIIPPAGESVRTGFADVAVDKAAKPVPWTELTGEVRAAFAAAVKRRENMGTSNNSRPPTAPLR
jgi:hypothetical protein